MATSPVDVAIPLLLGRESETQQQKIVIIALGLAYNSVLSFERDDYRTFGRCICCEMYRLPSSIGHLRAGGLLSQLTTRSSRACWS